MGIFTSKLGMPALVGEIFTGFLLGPPLADFVPYPEALVLVGEIGLIMLLLEAGVELDVAQLRETGTRALAIGFTGTILPLLVGLGLAMASGSETSIKSALAVGASFSPTSLGVAASALKVSSHFDAFLLWHIRCLSSECLTNTSYYNRVAKCLILPSDN